MQEIYYLGGAPCAGKTTAARALCRRHGLRAFELDRHLESAAHEGMLAGNALLRWASIAPPQESWRRTPMEQALAEWAVYRAASPYIRQALGRMGEGAPILAEGAGFLPEALHAEGVSPSRCLFLIPAERFQRAHYLDRPWVAGVLSQAGEAEAAFEAWMRRNALFAQSVRRQAQQLGYAVLDVDEHTDAPEVARRIERHFGWTK